MNSVDPAPQRDHWQELAEQLGLEPETNTVPTPSGMASHGVQAPDCHLESERQDGVERPGPAKVVTERAEIHELDAKKPNDPPDIVKPQPDPQGVEPAEIRHFSQQPNEDKDRPTRHREGGRSERGRSSNQGGRDVRRPRRGPEGPNQSPENSLAKEPSDRGPRQGRGRGRGRRSPITGEEEARQSRPEDQVEVENQESAPAGDFEADEIDTLSDWNVPSWADLISSLYRPDR